MLLLLGGTIVIIIIMSNINNDSHQANDKMSPCVAASENPASCCFWNDMLDASLQRYILSFLICKPTHSIHESTCPCCWKQQHYNPKPAIRNCLVVCKTWYTLTLDLVNEPNLPLGTATGGSLVSASDLVAIKSRVAKLDLQVVRQVFLEIIQNRWGHVEVTLLPQYHFDTEVVPALDLVMHRLACNPHHFGALVEAQYRQFLVTRCVELQVTAAAGQAKNQNDIGHDNKRICLRDEWQATYYPSDMVAAFWQAHMVHPLKYVQDCQVLLAGITGTTATIIDHNPARRIQGDISGKSTAKQGRLYAFEKSVTYNPDHGYGLFTAYNLNLQQMAQCMVQDMSREERDELRHGPQTEQEHSDYYDDDDDADLQDNELHGVENDSLLGE